MSSTNRIANFTSTTHFDYVRCIFIHFYIYLLISYAHRSNELSQIVFIQSVSKITGEILKEIDEINTTSAIENTQCTLCGSH